MPTKNHQPSCGARGLFALELGVFLEMCCALDTPRSLACYMLAENGEWQQYLDLGMPDRDSHTFADDYAVTEAMRKNPRLPGLSIDREKVAKEAWYRAEQHCRATNELLSAYTGGRISFPPATEAQLTKARRIIADILGPLGPRELKFAEKHFRFGPGATSSCSGTHVVLSRKMLSRFDVTPGLYPFWRSLLGETWGREVKEICLTSANKVTFVPKDATKDRAIAIEPHGNIYVQLGIGALIRSKLRRNIGLDLDVQAHQNRALAAKAQKNGLATIDLSSASDTIARELVWLLLPPDWAYLLDLARTPRSLIDGRSVELNKFSSMGNGYTFELETLIFVALARAAGDPDAVAFGDDIILLQSHAPFLVDTLSRLGFSVNTRKSFLAGRFFESCGADYYDGVNVRPPYFRGTYNDYHQAVIRTANKVRLYAHRRNNHYGCDIRLHSTWNLAVKASPIARRTAIPMDSGDDGLVKNFDEATPSRANHGHEGFITSVWRGRPVASKLTLAIGAYLAALHGGTPVRSRMDETVRGRTGKPQHARQLIPRWRDPGPWC